jgi:WhiB family transcriptional regulator, redox-sensing transcriptional regulator
LTGRDTNAGYRELAGPPARGSVAIAEEPSATNDRLGATFPLGLLREGLAGQFDPDLGWDQEARCRTHDPTLFFGPNRFEPKRERLAREAEAKAVCAGCPCLRACRDYALSAGELYGVWGGMGESDRREVLARRGSIATAV